MRANVGVIRVGLESESDTTFTWYLVYRMILDTRGYDICQIYLLLARVSYSSMGAFVCFRALGRWFGRGSGREGELYLRTDCFVLRQ